VLFDSDEPITISEKMENRFYFGQCITKIHDNVNANDS